MKRALAVEAAYLALLALVPLVVGGVTADAVLVVCGVLVLVCSGALGWLATHGGITQQAGPVPCEHGSDNECVDEGCWGTR